MSELRSEAERMNRDMLGSMADMRAEYDQLLAGAQVRHRGAPGWLLLS